MWVCALTRPGAMRHSPRSTWRARNTAAGGGSPSAQTARICPPSTRTPPESGPRGVRSWLQRMKTTRVSVLQRSPSARPA